MDSISLETTKGPFEVAFGTISGRRHAGCRRLFLGKNNQDACAFRVIHDSLVAVVCDGCSSGSASELGARLGAWMVVDSMSRCLEKMQGAEDALHNEMWLLRLLEKVRCRVITRLGKVGRLLGGFEEQALREAFLFTVLGILITPSMASVFAIGDGVFCLNGRMVKIGPFPDNAPPYLSYALMEEGLAEKDRLGGPRFEILESVPAQQFRHGLIATDGALPICESPSKTLPGRSDPVGPISRFWEEDLFFENPDALRRHLALANSQVVRADRTAGRIRVEHGLLEDDTTLFVVRRRRSSPLSEKGWQ